MKERIKKFYEEHKYEALLTLGVVLASATGVAYHKHAMDGMDVDGIYSYEHDGEPILVAHRKNGQTMTFKKRQT